MSDEHNVDVLIIGAGPTGLMCAFNLAQAGLSVRIVDSRPERLLTGRANGIHPRTTEIFHSLGLGDKAMANAARLYLYTTYQRMQGGDLVRVRQQDVQTKVDSPYKFMLINNQANLEGIFREAMGSGDKILRGYTVTPDAEAFAPRKIEVEQNVRVVQLSVSNNPETLADPHTYATTVVLEDAQGRSESVKAKYVLGCDGAHSWTRKQLGIEMVGTTTNDVWGVLDCHIDTDFPDFRTLCQIVDEGSQCSVVPRAHNLARLTAQINSSDVQIDPTTGRIDRDKIQPSTVERIVQRAVAPYRLQVLGPPDFWSVYVVGHRLATAYQDNTGRVLIAGDACHSHSPHAAQGMNAAFGDGYNLAWKLIHVMRGWADRGLLNTYESERRGYGQDLLQLHERMADITSGKVAGTITDLRVESGAFMTGTGIKYKESQIVDPMNQDLAREIEIGVRFPHQIVLRSADCWPVSTHDLLRSDHKYKLIIFTGDPTEYERIQLLKRFSERLSDWMKVWPRRAMIQVYTIMRSTKNKSSYTNIPVGLRTAWDTVFIDDIALSEGDGGGDAYERLGIEERGCMVLVRPDGHVAGIMPLGGVDELDVLVKRISGRV